ncbi:MAG: ThiF family adenylyltransferase [Candidatus Thermoplasmatota archaeon]|nr:ThiF family adenylyltransferase [Candidatus Thermoplasmatota archaeon]
MERYARQLVLPEIGEEGQSKIIEGSVAVFGLGALGSTISEALARTGVGKLRLVDRDFVEVSNLNHQILYSEKDIGMPKAEAAVDRIKKINSDVETEGEVVDINPNNIEKLIEDVDMVLDGTDNMEVRYIINDACVKYEVPWIYTAVLGTYGMSLNLIPEKTPCLRCIIPEKPSAGEMETCETAGVLSTLPRIMANIAATEAIKFLTGISMRKELLTVDIWNSDFELTDVERREGCRTCADRDFEFLQSEGAMTTELCGRGAVQINPGEKVELDLTTLEERFESSELKGENLIKVYLEDYTLNIFKDGRGIIEGTEDSKKAKSLYSRYIGN